MGGTLYKYVRQDFDVRETLAETLTTLSNSIDVAERERTVPGGVEICRATRAVFMALSQCAIDGLPNEHLDRMVAEFTRANRILRVIAAQSNGKEEYLLEHARLLTDRASRIAKRLSLPFASSGNLSDPFNTKYVFLSYVRENSADVDRIANELRAHGISLWLDRSDIRPGSRWKTAIRQAIHSGHFFLAVFSREYTRRTHTYMNEELTLAIEGLRQKPRNRTWFIPLCLSPCDLSVWPIGAGETMAELQFVDLQDNWTDGMSRVIATILDH